jgi:ppGpp synthetase/RelA/SpoT-type nucleotidyltranferase
MAQSQEKRYSKTQVQKAGETLIIDQIWKNDPESFISSMQILSDWRTRHVDSLNYITSILYDISRRVDKNAIVVKRLKRTPSIVGKLQRFKSMKLRNMQDIAGCRAILSKQKHVDKVRRQLVKSQNFKVTDYIKNPKDDGYRGVHLICKCNNGKSKDNYPVEIQLRTKIQHSWATAVEIIDLFTDQSLKQNSGKKEWLDFFKYIGFGFSRLDGDEREDIDDSVKKSLRLVKKLNIYKKFEAFTASLHFIESNLQIDSSGYNLILIDISKKSIKVDNFLEDEIAEATQSYLSHEKNAAKDTNNIVALVSTQSVGNLKEAYPNYFADSKLFLQNIKHLEILHRLENPTLLTKFLIDYVFKKKL